MASLLQVTTNSPAALVGRYVLRNFGRHGVHRGTVTSYDDDGELSFRVKYEDGDYEDLSLEDVEATLVELPSAAVSQLLSGQRKLVRVASRARRRAKDRDDSESDYMEEGMHSDEEVVPTSSQRRYAFTTTL